MNKKTLSSLPLFVTASVGDREASTSSLKQIVNKSKIRLGLFLLPTVLLASCGGDGDSSSSSSSSSSPTLNLNAAYSKSTIEGSSRSGTISGYCQGTRVWNLAATYSGKTLDGKPALIQNEYELDNMAANSNALCKNFYKSNDINKVTVTNYYDPNTIDIISSGSNPPTTVYQNQVPLPTSVTAGSSATWFNAIIYEKGIPFITSIQTWAVVADTSTTLTLITNNKAYTAAGNQLLFNQTTWYRINADNTFTNLRKNIQMTELGVFVFSGGEIKQSGDQNIDEVYQ